MPAYVFRGCSGKSVYIFSPSLPPLVTDTMNKAREKERGREGGTGEREKEREEDLNIQLGQNVEQ